MRVDGYMYRLACPCTVCRESGPARAPRTGTYPRYLGSSTATRSTLYYSTRGWKAIKAVRTSGHAEKTCPHRWTQEMGASKGLTRRPEGVKRCAAQLSTEPTPVSKSGRKAWQSRAAPSIHCIVLEIGRGRDVGRGRFGCWERSRQCQAFGRFETLPLFM